MPSANRNITPMQTSTYGIISKQVLWLTPYKIISHFYTLPSQFPNDRLSPTSIKTSEHTPTVSRRGFTPHSLSTDYTLTYPAFYNVTDTLCDDIKFYILQYTTLYYISQPKNGFVKSFFELFSLYLLVSPIKCKGLNGFRCRIRETK